MKQVMDSNKKTDNKQKNRKWILLTLIILSSVLSSFTPKSDIVFGKITVEKKVTMGYVRLDINNVKLHCKEVKLEGIDLSNDYHVIYTYNILYKPAKFVTKIVPILEK